MIKDWLIRTTDHEIIGPVAKEKVVELIETNKLKPEDELCCGNSFWFFVKEKEFIKENFNIEIEVNETTLSSFEANSDEFVLEKNCGESKVVSTSKEEVEEEQEEKANLDIVSAEDSALERDESGVDEPKSDDQPAQNDVKESDDVALGDKFNLPENVKKAVSKKEKVSLDIPDEHIEEMESSESRQILKDAIVPIIIALVVLMGILYVYYTKFLGKKIPLISESQAQELQIKEETQKKVDCQNVNSLFNYLIDIHRESSDICGMKKSEVEFLKKKLKSRKSKKSLFQEMPKLASVKIDESEIVKKYVSLNVSILSKVPLSRVYKMILFSKTGNKIKSNKEFKKIKNLSQGLVKYTLHDLCFFHFELCGLVRSAIFKNDLNQEQVIWFNDNIRSSIWELKNSFQVENFRLELGQGNKSIIKKIRSSLLSII